VTSAAPARTAAAPAPRKRSTPAAASRKAAPGAPARAGANAAPGAPRRLEDIPIEGEIAVPQVLFITARDQRRFVDFQYRSYLRTSLQVGESARFPSWIAVTPGPKPETQRKETSR
jgi:hypothetical protein